MGILGPLLPSLRLSLAIDGKPSAFVFDTNGTIFIIAL